MMGSIESKERPGIDEVYMVATASSNLRVGNDHTIKTPGDMIAAAGLNKHRTGLALRRLLTEWDKSAKPQRLSAGQINALAATYARVPGTGLVRITVREAGEEVHKEVLPVVAAEVQAECWYESELNLLFASLRTLPAVREGMLAHARAQGWEGDVHLVAPVLLWWLDSRCPVCEGRRNRIIAGTGRTGAKPCGECKGTGVKQAPRGWQGAKLLGHIKACLTAAARDLQEGTFRHQRTSVNETERLRVQRGPLMKLPRKIPPRRYSRLGKFYDGDYVTRSGQGDVHLVTDMDEEGYSATFVCVVAPSEAWCEVGHRELNLCRRYAKVEYKPAP